MTLVFSTIEVNPASSLNALPFIVHESLVRKFTYWNLGLRDGMQYGMELYTLFQSYPIEDRLKASNIGCEQTSLGIKVCITVSKTTYSVWLSLRSLNADLEDYSH